MQISTRTQAILLLTAHLPGAPEDAAKPLTPTEWGAFAKWLHDQALAPEELLEQPVNKILASWAHETITAKRIERLLQRGTALATSLDRWLRAGLWVVTRSDPEYPDRLRQRLGLKSPPFLFGSGNKELLHQGGLAVAGSRNAMKDDLEYSRGLGQLAARNACTIVSGGARGVDEAAMLGALEAGGNAVGVLANNLLRASTSVKYREYLMNGQLVLASPFHPEAGFQPGNAMQRNKYIYCLADAAVVVHSGHKGGTRSGAVENLKHGWVPMWVRRSGNAAIAEAGAEWLAEDIDKVDLSALLVSAKSRLQKEQTVPVAAPETATQVIEKGQDFESGDFYELFLAKAGSLCAEPKTEKELLAALGLHKSQLRAWLKQAVADKKLKKLSRPVRYQAVSASLPLFSDQS